MIFKDDRVRELFGEYPPDRLAKWKEWDALNPDIYPRFRELAFAIKATGRKVYSAYTIFYHMRFEYDIKTRGDVFKINNDYLSMYVRRLMYHHPEFDGFLKRREIRMKGIYSAEERRRRDEGDYLH